jgi:hypothetical protein
MLFRHEIHGLLERILLSIITMAIGLAFIFGVLASNGRLRLLPPQVVKVLRFMAPESKREVRRDLIVGIVFIAFAVLVFV